MKVDQGVLLEQKLALNEEAQCGLAQVNGFLKEDLKVDIPTGISSRAGDNLVESNLSCRVHVQRLIGT